MRRSVPIVAMPSEPQILPTIRAAKGRRVFARLALAIGISGALSWGATPIIIHAQLTAPALVPDTTPAPDAEKKSRSLKQWREEVKQRVDQLQKRLKTQAEADQDPPAPPPEWQVELLPRLYLTLDQLAVAREEAGNLQDQHNQQEEKLEAFRRDGFGEGRPTSFLKFDQTRDELRAAERGLGRLRKKGSTASAALDVAQTELNERSRDRRQAKEKVGDAVTQKTGPTPDQLHARAVLAEEFADAVSQLRKQEADNAKQDVATQKLRVELLENQVALLQSSVRFDEDELRKIVAAMRVEEAQLKSTISITERAKAEQQRRTEGLMQLLVAQLPAASSGETLREQVDASQLKLRALQENLPLLQKQLTRLGAQRDAWKQRRQLFIGRPERDLVREWTDAAEQILDQLDSDSRVAEYDLDELRSEIKQRSDHLNAAAPNSPEAESIQSQVESLKKLRAAYEQDFASIEKTQQLYTKVSDELKSDSLTASAKDRALDVWHGVVRLWNYELAVVGDSGVTIKKVVSALLLLAAGFICSRVLSRSLGRQVLRRLDIDASASATIQSLFYYLLLLLFSLVALKVVKVPLTAFTVLGGAVALGVGFGSQNIINNFISGLILLAERPVKVGDLIKVGDLYGNIEHIGPRSTRVRTGANLEIIVPNSSFLQNNVINYTLSNDRVRTLVEVGVVYGSPTVTVTQLLRRAVVETGRVAKDPPPIILFKSFGDSALVFEIHFWIRMRAMMDQLQIESAVRYRIDQLFRAEGITIAFPQQDVHLDTTSPLTVHMIETPKDSYEDGI